MPDDQQVWYAAFYLIGAAQLWYICLMKDAPMDEWEIFNWDLVCDYGPPISQDAIGDLAPPRHTGTVDDYIDSSTTYVLHVGITSELHQVNLFVTGLQAALRTAVAQHTRERWR